jgi:hypothetical protein
VNVRYGRKGSVVPGSRHSALAASVKPAWLLEAAAPLALDSHELTRRAGRHRLAFVLAIEQPAVRASSDLSLLGDLQGVVYLDSEVPHGRLQLGVPE